MNNKSSTTAEVVTVAKNVGLRPEKVFNDKMKGMPYSKMVGRRIKLVGYKNFTAGERFILNQKMQDALQEAGVDFKQAGWDECTTGAGERYHAYMVYVDA